MSRWLMPCLAALVLAGCGGSTNIAQFWRPISEPNIELPLDQGQKKLDYDLSQCHCGIYPTNVTQADLPSFEPDKERLEETSVTITPNDKGQCMQQPSLVVAECMRARGWEVTNCSGRMPLAGGGALCAGYAIDK